jgi:hypothetical protein
VSDTFIYGRTKRNRGKWHIYRDGYALCSRAPNKPRNTRDEQPDEDMCATCLKALPAIEAGIVCPSCGSWKVRVYARNRLRCWACDRRFTSDGDIEVEVKSTRQRSFSFLAREGGASAEQALCGAVLKQALRDATETQGVRRAKARRDALGGTCQWLADMAGIGEGWEKGVSEVLG